MLQSYLTSALRNIRRHKGYTFINVFGLAVGLAACLLISLFVRFELSFDRVHDNAKRIVRIEMDVENSGTGSARWKLTYLPVGPGLKERVPEIEEVVRIDFGGQYAIQYEDTRHYEDLFHYVDPSFFDVFDGFKVIAGDERELARPGTLLISESEASRYFGSQNPIGKTLTASSQYDQDTTPFEVVGVFADMPHNVHFRTDFLASFATYLLTAGDDPWGRITYTYALLTPGASPQNLADGLERYATGDLAGNVVGKRSLVTRPLTDIHLHAGPRPDIQPQSDIRYVWIFSAIAALILLIACINYMNLATARSASRSREVGVRKVVGAHRLQLMGQFLSESTLIAAGALVISLALAQFALPMFNAMMDRPLALQIFDGGMLAWLLGATLAVGLISGSYPALVLSRLRPAGVLKGGSGGRSSSTLRKGLVVFQFAISIGLVIGTVAIHRQLGFIRDTHLGFAKEQTMTIDTRGRLGSEVTGFRDQLAGSASVLEVAMSSSVPGEGGWTTGFRAEQISDYDGEPLDLDLIWVDEYFVETLGLEVVDGRVFDPEHATDLVVQPLTTDTPSRAFDPARSIDLEEAVMLNETAVKAIGWSDPVGKTFQRGERTLKVIGVVKDFHITSLKNEVKPLIMQMSNHNLQYATIRLATSDLPGAIASIRNTWDAFIPGLPFQYSFLDDKFDAMYRSEQRLSGLIGAFSTVAILISALGLFGLAAYTAQQRTKEIGIRKVLGASVSGLVVLLSREFVLLVLVAFVVVAPLAWFAMDRWLSSFAYRTEIGPGIFVISGLLALLVALVTVAWQAIRAARADPATSLRYE